MSRVVLGGPAALRQWGGDRKDQQRHYGQTSVVLGRVHLSDQFTKIGRLGLI
jgi:hypothetical protein